ncbi:MAG TPA: c-type cytochrome [Anaerolineales bacterium]
MKRSELITRILITVTIVGLVGAALTFWSRTPLIHARVAENGGWSPNVIQAKVGMPLQLSLTSDDVTHGFVVGQMDMQSVDIMPGKVTNLTLTFDKPGIYTFYCTRWCGLNHWRMRGTIEVTGGSNLPQPITASLYVTLGLNIDTSHDASVIPNDKPSAIRGQQLANNLSVSKFINADFYRTHSPYQTFENLNSNDLSDPEKWDVVAYVWESNTTPEALANGKKLFAQNCAACHGETGAGNGVFANRLAALGETSKQNMAGEAGMTTQTPANFTDPKRMLGASPALLQGKILRGGMGTGMPSWGPIFTPDQIWDLIAYLYSFQFEYQK